MGAAWKPRRAITGLYHYVGGKDELLFLVLDHDLDRLLHAQAAALAAARTPEATLLALVRTHLDFGFQHAAALKLINRDWELVDEPRRAEIAAKRRAYVERGLVVLRELDQRDRSGDELLSATNLLLGMLNGIATRPFLRSGEDAATLAHEVAALFLYGFLERSTDRSAPAAVAGETHDA